MMKFDEFNAKMHELTMTYSRVVRWNEDLRAELDEARKLAERLNDERNHWGPGRIDLPWGVEK
jgi:hypothetical protein